MSDTSNDQTQGSPLVRDLAISKSTGQVRLRYATHFKYLILKEQVFPLTD
jgi:hypothetical protein